MASCSWAWGHVLEHRKRKGSIGAESEPNQPIEPEDKQVAHEPEDKQVAHGPEDKQVAHEPEDKQVAHEPEDKQVAHEPEDKQVAHEPEDKQVAHEPEDKQVSAVCLCRISSCFGFDLVTLHRLQNRRRKGELSCWLVGREV